MHAKLFYSIKYPKMKILITSLCLLISVLTFAQQDKQFTNYMFDRMSFNPGATGLNGFNTTVIGRNQWVGTDHSPYTLLANIQGELPKLKSGIGLTMYADRIGFGTTQDVKLNFSHAYDLGKLGTLHPGIGVGIVRKAFDLVWVSVWPNDPDLPIGENDVAFDLSSGLYLQGNADRYYFGVSVTHLTTPFLESVNFQTARHYYALGGVNLGYDQLAIADGLVLKPSFLVISDGVTTTFDVSLLGDYSLEGGHQVYGGVTYRRKDAIALLAGYVVSAKRQKNDQSVNFRIGYSYDITISSINNTSRGSHELILSFGIPSN